MLQRHLQDGSEDSGYETRNLGGHCQRLPSLETDRAQKAWKYSRRPTPNKLKRNVSSGGPKTRETDPHPSLSAACVGETVIPALGYEVIADKAPGTTTPGNNPVCNHSLPRLVDTYYL